MSSKKIWKIQNTSWLSHFGTDPKSHILVLEPFPLTLIKKLFYWYVNCTNIFVSPNVLFTLHFESHRDIVVANLGFINAKTCQNPPKWPQTAVLIHVGSTLGGVPVAAHQEHGCVEVHFAKANEVLAENFCRFYGDF